MSALLDTVDDHTSAACLIVRPPRQTCSLLFSSPHSGRDYPPEFLAESRLDARALRRSEDSFVEELFGGVPGWGAPLLAASFPRAYCDVNRERWELDPDMFDAPLPLFCNTTSRRVASGFGTIARVVGNGEVIHRRKLSFEEAKRRIETCWEPYHSVLQAMIDETRQAFGHCLLIDCHSMPGETSNRHREAANFVLGDAHGVSCAPEIVRLVEDSLTRQRYSVRRNDPYAGGFVTRHYGKPELGVHVLQIEIARSLYMDERRNEKRKGFETLRADLEAVVSELVAGLGSQPGLLGRR